MPQSYLAWYQPWLSQIFLLCRVFMQLNSTGEKYIPMIAAAAAKSLQSCPTLCDPIDGSPPGSPFPGILQARTLEWVAISFSNAWKWKVKVKMLWFIAGRLYFRPWMCLAAQSCLFETLWTVAHQAPLSMGILQARTLEWVAMPSSRGSSQSRDQTQVSLIVGGFFTIWALRGFLGYLDSVSFSTTPWFIILFYLTSWKGVNGKIIWF